jgi:penicillin-binding protein 2
MFLKNYKIKNKYSASIEPHEVFLDNLEKNKETESGFSEKRFEVPLKERKAYILFSLFILIIVLISTKVFYLQVFEGKNLHILAENNKGKIVLIKPERGIIYDRNLKKMVLNSPAFDLVCDRRGFPDSSLETKNQIEKLAVILNKDAFDLEKQINDSQEPVVLIQENLSHEIILILEARIKEFKGCLVEDNIIRNYVLGEPFSHLLGYVSRITQDEFNSQKTYAINDSSGKSGLEKSYEQYLRGIPGKLETQKTAVGIQKNQEIISEPVSGNNIVLNIDSDLQQKIYEELEKSVKDIGSKKASAVALDPRNGQVLALVSFPSYDNNLFAKGISQKDLDLLLNDTSQPFFNRAISAQYPTGSTIKPFEALGALQEKLISPTKLINDPGYIEVKSKYDSSIVYRFGGVTPHGWVDMREAIAVSSNIYFYTIGGGYLDQQGLGPTRIAKYLSLFGWGVKTGIDLPGEFKGFIPSPEWKKEYKKESWWDGDTYNLAIGQSDLQVTPLQLALAYATIANGGILYKPQIVNKIIDTSTTEPSIVLQFESEIVRQDFIDKENLKVVQEGMRDGVAKSYGSSYFLNNLPVAVASKTGTAEIGKDGYYNTWVSTYGPYENPNIVLVVTIEEVEGLRSGSLTVAKEVLNWYFSQHK